MFAVSTARISGEENTVSTWGYSNRSFRSASWARPSSHRGMSVPLPMYSPWRLPAVMPWRISCSLNVFMGQNTSIFAKIVSLCPFLHAGRNFHDPGAAQNIYQLPLSLA